MNPNETPDYMVDPTNVGETKAYVQGYRDGVRDSGNFDHDEAYTHGHVDGYRTALLAVLNDTVDWESFKQLVGWEGK